MKEIHRTYKLRIYPTKTQEVLLEKHFGCARFVYNYFLNESIEQYKETKKSDGYNKQSANLTILKKKEEYVWLNEVNAQTLNTALRNLDSAYQSFFKGKSKIPKFKSKKDNKRSATFPQKNKIKNGKLQVIKFKEGIKIDLHREVKGDIKKCTISKTPTGKYFASILTEQEYEPKQKTGKSCGVDLGLKDFFVTSDSDKFKNNKYTDKYAKKLKTAQQYLSRKTKGSNSYEKQRRKVALIYEKTTNSRKDNLHKVSTQLINDYDIICVETLNVKGMIKDKRLSKSISDVSWYTFVTMLEYKANWNDKQVIKIDPFFPSSKTCNVCGWVNHDLKLKDREWTCSNGHVLDRDVNASKNILKEGLKLLTSAGTVDYTGGDLNKSSVQQQKHKSKKPETVSIQ